MTKRLLTAAKGAAPAQPGCPLPAPVGIDLHVHSVYSDGVRTPEELGRMARKAGLSWFALCDHDTANGVPHMRHALEGTGIALIPGVEISTGQGGRTHVLCYGERVLSAEMRAFLGRMADERIGRAAEMMRLLENEGVFIPEERRAELLRASSVGRTHIARAIVETGAVNTVRQAFERYLTEGRPAYVPRKLLLTADAVAAARSMGAVPVLAHPMRMGLEQPALHALIRSLKDCGLMGLEAYHPSAPARSARLLDALARQEHLLVTGGSDYHGDPSSTVHIGRLPSGWLSRSEDVSALCEAIATTHFKGVTRHV